MFSCIKSQSGMIVCSHIQEGGCKPMSASGCLTVTVKHLQAAGGAGAPVGGDASPGLPAALGRLR